MKTDFVKKMVLKNIKYELKLLKKENMEELIKIKNDIKIHEERFKLQDEEKAKYIGAFIKNKIIGFVVVSLKNKTDVMPYTNNKHCADMIDLFVIELFRNLNIGKTLIKLSEKICKSLHIPYLGLDVNPKDNEKAYALYKKSGYKPVGSLHLDGVYPSFNEQGNEVLYEDWCIDMIKKIM